MKSIIFYKTEKTSPVKFFKGYVNIFVEGVFLERFINICRSKNIILWNIERKKSTIMYANISIEDFKNIRRIANKTKCRVKINNKKGLPFLFYKYKKRKVFLICLMLVILSLIIFSQFLWNVELIVKDSENIENFNQDELIRNLEEAGLKTGVLKGNINVNNVINSVRLNRKDIAWMGINVKGTNAIVEVVFSTEKPDIVNNSDYCSIIADKEGIIYKISAQNGTPQVKVGDLVRKGDKLIVGWIEGKYTGKEPVHSMGNIKAKVWYSKKEKQNYKQELKIETGNIEEKYAIKFNNFQINLFKTPTKFEKSDKIVENKKLQLFSNFYLPIELIKITNKECDMQEKVYSEDELKEEILKKLDEELLKQIRDNNDMKPLEDLSSIITDKQVIVKKEKDSLEVELVYEVIENVGVEEKLNLEEIVEKEKENTTN